MPLYRFDTSNCFGTRKADADWAANIFRPTLRDHVQVSKLIRAGKLPVCMGGRAALSVACCRSADLCPYLSQRSLTCFGCYVAGEAGLSNAGLPFQQQGADARHWIVLVEYDEDMEVQREIARRTAQIFKSHYSNVPPCDHCAPAAT